MVKVTLKNGKEHDALNETVVYPSGNPNIRSRMEIHMAEDAMTAAEFETAFMDETATVEIKMQGIADADDPGLSLIHILAGSPSNIKSFSFSRLAIKASTFLAISFCSLILSPFRFFGAGFSSLEAISSSTVTPKYSAIFNLLASVGIDCFQRLATDF